MADATFTVDILMNIIDAGTKKTISAVETSTKKIEKNIENTTKQTQKLNKETKKMDFGFLSEIFAGMMLQRTFGGFLTSAIQGFMNFAGKQDESNHKLLKMSGAWEYLKFQIGESFTSSPLISGLIDGLTNVINVISSDPKLVDTITNLAIALTALGTALYIKGQGTTLLMALDNLIKGIPSETNIPVDGVTKGLDTAKTSIDSKLSAFRNISLFVGFTIAYLGIMGIIDAKNLTDYILSLLETAFGVGLVILGLGGGVVGAGMAFTAVVSLGLIYKIVDEQYEKATKGTSTPVTDIVSNVATGLNKDGASTLYSMLDKFIQNGFVGGLIENFKSLGTNINTLNTSNSLFSTKNTVTQLSNEKSQIDKNTSSWKEYWKARNNNSLLSGFSFTTVK